VSDAPPPPPPPPAGGTGYGYAQQAQPYVLASKGKRLGGMLLDAVLVVVTLVIGWVIWWVILWKQGQSPAKQILKMRVYKLSEGRAANTSEMAIRELVGKWLLSFIPFYGLVSAIIVLTDPQSQGLWDKIAGTVVIDDPNDQFRPAGV
jgi:uncharacterized RDD family membrane protein YckC